MKLKELKRFVNSKNKIPLCKWKDQNNWLTYDEALKNAKDKNLGISIVLGKINDEYTLAGIDYDTVRDKNTGLVDKDIYFETKSFKHIHKSLSGYGIHILCLVKNNVKLLNGMKKYIDIKTHIERYDEGNTGVHGPQECGEFLRNFIKEGGRTAAGNCGEAENASAECSSLFIESI